MTAVIQNEALATQYAANQVGYMAAVDSKGRLLVSGATASGLSIPSADYISVAQTNATTETYTYKTGGSGGTTVATIVIVYTSAARELLASVTLTTP